MSLNNSKEEMSENELSNCKKFINLDLNSVNKEENNYLPTFLIESLNENEDNYFKDDDQFSNEEMNTIDSFNEKNISYNIDFNYKMH